MGWLANKTRSAERKVFGDFLAQEVIPASYSDAALMTGVLTLSSIACVPLEATSNARDKAGELYGKAKKETLYEFKQNFGRGVPTDTSRLKESSKRHSIPKYVLDAVKLGKKIEINGLTRIVYDDYMAKILPEDKTVTIGGQPVDRKLIRDGAYIIPTKNHEREVTYNGVITSSDERYAIVNVEYAGEGLVRVNTDGELETSVVLLDTDPIKTKRKSKGQFVSSTTSRRTWKKQTKLSIECKDENGKKVRKTYDILATNDGIEGDLERLQGMINVSAGKPFTKVSYKDGKTKTRHCKRVVQYVPVLIDGFDDVQVMEIQEGAKTIAE